MSPLPTSSSVDVRPSNHFLRNSRTYRLASAPYSRLALRFATAFNTTYFFMNTRVAPFDDVRVRRAVTDAFDEDAFAASEGPQYAPTCRILPPNFPAYQSTCPDASAGPQGIDRARKQVESAGVTGMRVTVWTLSPVRTQAEYIASLLRSIGFRADVKAIVPVPDPSGYFNQVADPANRAQIGFGGWISDYPSAAGFIPPILSCAGYTPQSPESSTNLAAYCNPAIDAKMIRASGLQAQPRADVAPHASRLGLRAPAQLACLFGDPGSQLAGCFPHEPPQLESHASPPRA